MTKPMNDAELDEVRRWALSHEHDHGEGSTIADTYLRLLATIERSQKQAKDIAANYLVCKAELDRVTRT